MGLSLMVRMRAIRSRAIAGVAVASLTMTKRSPMMTPEFGSPSAVYAQQCLLSCSNVIFLSARSAWLANALDMPRILSMQRVDCLTGDLVERQAGVDHDHTFFARGIFERGELAGHER